jgi:HemY protein
LIRALPALVGIAVLIAISVFIADRPGTVELTWQDWRIDTSVAVLVLGTGAVAMIAAALFHLLRKLIGAPHAIRRSRHERRRAAGYRALTQGMVAVAAGEAAEALKLARKADVLLAEPPLTLLLSAQAAQLNGDRDAARKYFTAMLERGETEFLGLRGLLMQALHTGDEALGLKLVERAKTLHPRTIWVLNQLYELQTRAGQWTRAEATLGERLARNAIDAVTARRHRAVLLHEESREAEAAGDGAHALTLAGGAFASDPGFAPGAARYARLQAAQGAARRAMKILASAWRAAPHPDLAAAYHSLFPDETPVQRVKRVERLAAVNVEHLESRLALAKAALTARLWGEARRRLPVDEPSPRVCRLMADIEEGEHGDHAAARAWLARAVDTPFADPAYVCDICGAATPEWVAICPHCRAFASLSWRTPKGDPLRLATSAAGSELATVALVDASPTRLLRSARPADRASLPGMPT